MNHCSYAWEIWHGDTLETYLHILYKTVLYVADEHRDGVNL